MCATVITHLRPSKQITDCTWISQTLCFMCKSIHNAGCNCCSYIVLWKLGMHDQFVCYFWEHLLSPSFFHFLLNLSKYWVELGKQNNYWLRRLCKVPIPIAENQWLRRYPAETKVTWVIVALNWSHWYKIGNNFLPHMFAALTEYLSLIEYGHVKFSNFGHVAETSHYNIA
mgnify:CR=1 FL=1